MEGNVSVDERLEDLRWDTEALLDAMDLSESLAALLDTREQRIRALQSAAKKGGLSQPQLLKLKSLIESGSRVRKPMALRKELLKQQVEELRASKRAQALFSPAFRGKGQRLNIEL
jgi:chromatin segregation and condensation protein Rec8/ScpA/Scc1 (kleisin family)